MSIIPKFENMYEYENNFLLTTKPERLGKMIVQYELMLKTINVPGDIVEFGVFKGASFSRLAIYRNLLGLEKAKKIIGFDTFGKFPNPESENDKRQKKVFTTNAGDQSIERIELEKILVNNGCSLNCDLIEGDILQTLPEYLKKKPEIKFSYVNIDVDLGNVTDAILKGIYEHLSFGGVMLFDDYGFFADATTVIDSFCHEKKLDIHCNKYSKSPSYIIKKRTK